MKRKRQLALSPVLRLSRFMSVMEAVWRVLAQCTVCVCVCVYMYVCVCGGGEGGSVMLVSTKLLTENHTCVNMVGTLQLEHMYVDYTGRNC